MRELQAGVWHWEAPHPEWKASDEWDELVSSYTIDDGARLLLFDPLALDAELEELAARRETVIVLTSLARAGYTEPGRALRRRGVRALSRRGRAHRGPAAVLPRRPVAGVQAFLGMDANDLILRVERHGAVVAGDAIIDRGNGLEIPADWVGDGLEQVRESLREVLELHVKHVLATHGGPSDRSALERALA